MRQVIDEGDPQKMGERPKFARSEYRYGLVGLQEIEDVMLVQLAVVVNDQLHGKIVSLGLPPVRSISQCRKLLVKFHG